MAENGDEDLAGSLVDFYNEQASELTADEQKLKEVESRGMSRNHPNVVHKIGEIAGKKFVLNGLRAFIEFHAAESAGRLNPSDFNDEPPHS